KITQKAIHAYHLFYIHSIAIKNIFKICIFSNILISLFFFVLSKYFLFHAMIFDISVTVIISIIVVIIIITTIVVTIIVIYLLFIIIINYYYANYYYFVICAFIHYL
ncbi:hypothetical protein WUBG_06134, partial [Wuchereria bancrofti]